MPTPALPKTYDALILVRDQGGSVLAHALKAITAEALAKLLADPPVTEGAPPHREGEIWETNGRRYTLKNGRGV